MHLTGQPGEKRRSRVKMMTLHFKAVSGSTQGVVRLAHCDSVAIPR